MIASRTDARDRILTPLKAVADAQSLYAVYDDTAKTVPTDQSIKWVRISVRHASGSRASLGRADKKSKHTQSGFVFVEIYTPREDGLQDSDVLSAAFADNFRNPADGDIWFGDVNEMEMGPDGNWFRSDVVAEFQYDLIQ
jgi:hypothetical protein